MSDCEPIYYACIVVECFIILTLVAMTINALLPPPSILTPENKLNRWGNRARVRLASSSKNGSTDKIPDDDVVQDGSYDGVPGFNPRLPFGQPSHAIQPQEAHFAFKQHCQDQLGIVGTRNPSNDSDKFSGTLLTCSEMEPYGTPETVLFSELDGIQKRIASGELRPQNEKERLEIYFRTVYPLANPLRWVTMSLAQLQDYYQRLELYYKLPDAIMPTTLITPRRSANNQFYRVPSGVVLDQDQNRKGITEPYIEVIRFGSAFSLYNDPTAFNGTYYYPVRGSGLYIPVGRSLLAYNKVHALKLLRVANKDLLVFGGRDFQNFLKKDSNGIWKDIVAKNPSAQRDQSWVSTCVVDKHATKSDKGCPLAMGWFTKKVEYIPEALDRMVAEMVSGKSLRIDSRKQLDGTMKDVKVYYGGSDTMDRYIAQLARNRGYDTLQCLREAQMSVDGDALVGNEIIKLEEPVYSQAEYVRLDPFATPYLPPYDPQTEASVQYLLDGNISAVSPEWIAKTLYEPFNAAYTVIDVVVPARN